MSRKISSKIKISGDLIAITPISVGTTGTGELVDIDIAIDGQGRYYIPGSSIAGPIRAWVAENFSEAAVISLFGYMYEKKNKGNASSIFIEDGHIDKDAFRERRHGIEIERHSGVTKKGSLYSRALLPKETCFPLEMEIELCENDKNHDEITKILYHLLVALKDGEIKFGACKTRGFGTLKLQNLKVSFYKFSNNNDIDNWLNECDAAICGDERELGTFEPLEKKTYKIEIAWKPKSNIMVKSGADGVDADMLPLVSGVNDDEIVPVIPGSSLKGMLRAQAEKILHTLIDSDKSPGKVKGLIDKLFGSKENAGRLSVDDVYSKIEPIKREAWLSEDLNALNKTSTKQQHVAIDRFTGGASEGALYSARPVKNKVNWEPITIHLNSQIEPKEIALVKFLIRDLKDGYMTLGFGSTRGLGEISFGDGDIVYSNIPDNDELENAWREFLAGKADKTDQKGGTDNVE